MSLTLDRFSPEDLPGFMRLAAAEGWLCDQWEFDFLLRQSLAGCYVIRSEEQAVAYVTAIAYGTAGWIGNLIVEPVYRQQGLGRWLMQTALAFLDEVETVHVLLTASPQGAPLYAALGFREIDRIERWVGNTTGKLAGHRVEADFDRLCASDAAGWGAPRRALLWEKAQLAESWQNDGGFIMRQTSGNRMQIGPWGGMPDAAAELFALALTGSAGGGVFLDVPAANLLAADLLGAAGFTRRGESLFMCRGAADGYVAAHVFALGTMGSSG